MLVAGPLLPFDVCRIDFDIGERHVLLAAICSIVNDTVGSIVAVTCGGGEFEDPALDENVDAPKDNRAGFPNKDSV